MPDNNLNAERYDRSYSYFDLMKRIFGYFGIYKKIMLIIVCFIILTSLANIITPVLFSKSITDVTKSFNTGNIFLVMVLLLGSGALSWLFNLGRQWMTAHVISNVIMMVRQDAFKAVLKRDMAFFDENPSGSVASRILYDTQSFSGAVGLTLELLSNIFLLLPIMSVCFYINTSLAIMLVGMVPLIVILPFIITKIRRLLTQRNQRGLAIINSKVQETISCITVAKNFRQEKNLFGEFRDFNQQAYKTKLYWGMGGMISHVLDFFVGIATVCIVYFGGISALEGRISTGQWYLFVQSISIFWWPIINISSFWNNFQDGLVAGERVFALVDAEPKVIQNDDKPVEILKGRIEFKDMDFSYIEGQDILNKFNLTIEAEETVALVGYSGAGKSSLGKLVARFYEFQNGKLYIDGKDIRSYDLISYRRNLGIVPQIPFLFTGTVIDNIRYSSPNATDEEVEAVAKQIGGGDWIDSLPQGMQTYIGEMGKGISMGQRQLISLARVLLQNPSIIIMDEATASIDPLTEVQIQKSIDLVLKERTAIIIAHRLSTIKNADRIIVLEDGRIVEEGNHEELLTKQNYYAELYEKYFYHQEVST